MSGDPNVFLLSADSVRADAVTDAVDALAAATGGTRFRNAVAPASHTASSVPGLATGRFADGTGPEGLGERPGETGPADPASVVEAFRAAGYETVIVTDNPLLAASLGEGGGSSGQLLARLDEAVPRAITRVAERAYFRLVRPAARRLGLLGPYYRPAPALHEAALDRIASADAPVFCWIHYMDAHSPYWPPGLAEDGGRADAGTYRTAARSRSLAVRGAEAAVGADLGAVRALYRRTCEELGDAVVRFVRRLRREGYFDPAADVLGVTADHGECLDPGRGVIGHVPPASWESLVHVPLVVARPDWPETGVDEQVSLIDLPRMLRGATGAGDGGAEPPASFGREHAVTVARTLGASQYVRGVRSSDGRKLFGRRTAAGVDIVRTTFEVGRPGAERVVETRSPDEAWDELATVLDRYGGPTGEASTDLDHDESQLRALGYLE